MDHVPSRNKFIPIAAAAANPRAIPHMWGWYQDHLTELESFHPLLYERVVSAIIPMGGLHAPDTVTAFFNDYLKKESAPEDAIKMSLEMLEINRKLRAANP